MHGCSAVMGHGAGLIIPSCGPPLPSGSSIPGFNNGGCQFSDVSIEHSFGKNKGTRKKTYHNKYNNMQIEKTIYKISNFLQKIYLITIFFALL